MVKKYFRCVFSQSLFRSPTVIINYTAARTATASNGTGWAGVYQATHGDLTCAHV